MVQLWPPFSTGHCYDARSDEDDPFLSAEHNDVRSKAGGLLCRCHDPTARLPWNKMVHEFRLTKLASHRERAGLCLRQGLYSEHLQEAACVPVGSWPHGAVVGLDLDDSFSAPWRWSW